MRARACVHNACVRVRALKFGATARYDYEKHRPPRRRSLSLLCTFLFGECQREKWSLIQLSVRSDVLVEQKRAKPSLTNYSLLYLRFV